MGGQLEHLRRRYRERAGDRLRMLRQALVAGDRQGVASIAHRLSGSGASFGFAQVSFLAEPLELAAEQGRATSDLHRLAEPLLTELARIAQPD